MDNCVAAALQHAQFGGLARLTRQIVDFLAPPPEQVVAAHIVHSVEIKLLPEIDPIAVTGHFQIAGEAVPGVRVPRGAVLRQEGRAWVYVQIDERSFARRLILLEHADERGWIISGGVTDKDRIVVVGAQAMLSEELGAASFLSGARE